MACLLSTCWWQCVVCLFLCLLVLFYFSELDFEPRACVCSSTTGMYPRLIPRAHFDCEAYDRTLHASKRKAKVLALLSLGIGELGQRTEDAKNLPDSVTCWCSEAQSEYLETGRVSPLSSVQNGSIGGCKLLGVVGRGCDFMEKEMCRGNV